MKELGCDKLRKVKIGKEVYGWECWVRYIGKGYRMCILDVCECCVLPVEHFKNVNGDLQTVPDVGFHHARSYSQTTTSNYSGKNNHINFLYSFNIIFI